MSAKNKVHVFVRVKPTDNFAHDMIRYGDDKKSIAIHLKKDTRKGVVNNQQTDWSFKLDGVLHDASQDLVYETVAKDVVSRALEGYNGTIMCYGQTGAGKTYTMIGATKNYTQRGILPRALQQVFKMIDERPTHDITVHVSYVEIYNESMFDLLSNLSYAGSAKTPMAILENPQGVYIKGLSVHHTQQEEDAFIFLFEGETNKIITSHTLNKNSSRSHCIFTIYVEAHSRTLSEEKYITSKINLVDLAGSERMEKTGSRAQNLKETNYINKSLSFLEQAIIALGEQKRDHIPFRQCKLTHVLKDSLGGNCNMVLVTNVYGEASQLEETLSSLRFASRMKLIPTEPAINERYDAKRMVKNLEKELALLKQELAIHDSLASRTLVTYDPLDEIQIAEINSQVRRYLEGTLDEIDIINLRQIREVFNQFRVVLSQQEQDVEATLRRKYTLIDKNDFAAISAVQKAGLTDAEGHLVGESDGQSFGLGVAPFSTKPGKKSKARKTFKDVATASTKKEDASSPGSTKDMETNTLSRTQLLTSPKDGEVKDVLVQEREISSNEPLPSDSPREDLHPTRPTTPPSKSVAFEEFKSERGSEINRIFKDNKSILNERRKRASETTQRINAIKREIDVTKEALNFKKLLQEKQDEYENENKGLMIIDEEEFLLLQKLKDLKMQYRSEYQDLQDLRAEMQYCQHLVDQCRHRLLTEFDIWYSESFSIPKDVQEAPKPPNSIQLDTEPTNRLMSLGEDEQEKYRKLQQSVLLEGPESISFYNAKFKVEQKTLVIPTGQCGAAFRLDLSPAEEQRINNPFAGRCVHALRSHAERYVAFLVSFRGGHSPQVKGCPRRRRSERGGGDRRPIGLQEEEGGDPGSPPRSDSPRATLPHLAEEARDEMARVNESGGRAPAGLGRRSSGSGGKPARGSRAQRRRPGPEGPPARRLALGRGGAGALHSGVAFSLQAARSWPRARPASAPWALGFCRGGEVCVAPLVEVTPGLFFPLENESPSEGPACSSRLKDLHAHFRTPAFPANWDLFTLNG
ncbi:PREDICTED: kinesin-like protein KIF9 [Elephantulus edwardii]|uniref:kinesin-like protein KIF9 n=1 Tax=Elephantulus edwardii TaxID=28737 RepID=UPI0003F06D34|nr:PREDICTED: kinesin-like protein KIF9 [Elephantulus edwardii]